MLGLGIVLIHILVWGGLFGGGGLSLLLYGRKLNQKPAPPAGWSAAKGKVTSIEVARIPKPGSGMSGFAPVMGYSSKARTIWCPSTRILAMLQTCLSGPCGCRSRRMRWRGFI